MTKSIVSFFILCLVLISGCIGQQPSSGEGVVIENFVSSPSEVYSGESFQLQMMIRNRGTVDAENVRFELSNTGVSYESRGLEISCEPECSEVIERLLAPDPQAGTTGESKTCIWRCSSPENVPRNAKITFNPILRIYYDYETMIAKSVTIVSEDELRSLQDQGKPLPSEIISQTSGPITLGIQMRSPVKYVEETNKVTFPMSVIIENVGGGVACHPSCSDPLNWNKVFLSLDAESGVVMKDCEVGISNEVDLWEGRSRTIVCDGELSLFSETARRTGVNILQKTMGIKATYQYFTDATTSVVVTGY